MAFGLSAGRLLFGFRSMPSKLLPVNSKPEALESLDSIHRQPRVKGMELIVYGKVEPTLVHSITRL